MSIKLFLFSILIAFHIWVFWQGIKVMNHVPTAIGIYFTFPLWIAIISSFFLKEKFNKFRVISLLLGTVGALFAIKLLPSLSLSSVNINGVLLMTVAAITWAIGLIVRQRVFTKYSNVSLLFYNFLISSIVFWFLQSPAITLFQLTPEIMKYILLMAVVSTYIAYILIYQSVKYIKASNAGIVSLIKPVLGIGFAYLILHQITNLFQSIGVILIILAVCLIYKERNNA